MKRAAILVCVLLGAALGARAQDTGSATIYTDSAAHTQVAEAKPDVAAARAQIYAAKVAAVVYQAADVKMDQAVLRKLAAKADQAVDVTLDQPMLQLASAFLSAKDPEQAQAKKLVGKLQGVYVHSYQFGKAGEYSAGDIESLRAPFQSGAWSRALNVRSKRDGQNVEVYLRKSEGKIQGLVVIATEPQQVTFVNILGEIDPEDLTKLGGQFGIPLLQMAHPHL